MLERWDSIAAATRERPGNWLLLRRVLRLARFTWKNRATIQLTKSISTCLTLEHWDYGSVWMAGSTSPAWGHCPLAAYLACWPYPERLVNCWPVAAMAWRAARTAALIGRRS